ncbi:S41 family peptidase [Methylopila musalis]|uniref:S41 family peptidase n=1 Tax=Methylopila musalis TaxID=1134781 RepID=A0ABW3Z3J9_9HYPH
MMRHRLVMFAGGLAAALTFAAGPTAAAALSAEAHGAGLDRAAIDRTVGRIATELREAYVFPDRGATAADALEAERADGAYADATDPAVFARRLTDRLRALTGDGHVRVISGSPFGPRPSSPGPEGDGFEVTRLEGGVGYLHVARFAPPETFAPAADAAMSRLADTAALIVDMRDNGGGHPASVAYLVSFFLDPDARVHINDLVWRERGTTTFRTESFWSSPTPTRYLARPVYVLVGPKTYSAGEEFAYDLQALRRATVVGATTRGGANPGGLTELGADLFVVVPTGRAENPVTRGNWEGVGVRPDVETAPETAKDVATALALARLATTP